MVLTGIANGTKSSSSAQSGESYGHEVLEAVVGEVLDGDQLEGAEDEDRRRDEAQAARVPQSRFLHAAWYGDF